MSKSIEACTEGRWSILTHKTDGSSPSVRVFRCKSWRHPGECREYCERCDYARILKALEAHNFWTYLILTYPHRQWPRVEDLFRFGVVSWSRLRKRLIYHYGDIKYIQTWEIHKQSEYPHVNVVISNRELYLRVHENFMHEKKHVLEPMASACGFGFVKWVAPDDDKEHRAKYITKMGLELSHSGVKGQLPVNAPKHFRRIRATVGLLPKRYKDDTVTGCLLHYPAAVVESALNDSGG